jgi:sulfite reductase beta subunit-like hemoprotein
MIDLSKEAEEYAAIPSTLSLTTRQKIQIAYVAGATDSKYVQAKIIQAQIDSLTMVLNCYNLLHEDVNDLHLTLDRLKQQLKQLGNE